MNIDGILLSENTQRCDPSPDQTGFCRETTTAKQSSDSWAAQDRLEDGDKCKACNRAWGCCYSNQHSVAKCFCRPNPRNSGSRRSAYYSRSNMALMPGEAMPAMRSQ